MYADICDAADTEAIARLRKALMSLGAILVEQDWAMGVDVYRMRISDEDITIYSDTWSIDMEGPDEVVGRIMAAITAAT